MPAPTVSFTVIPDSDIDPESPITETLMTAIRDDLQHLREWIGHGFTPAQAHSHDGIDSRLLAGNVAGNLFMYINYP